MGGGNDDEGAEYTIHAGKIVAEDVDLEGLHSEATPQYRNVGIFSLLVIAFFWASGGIYGNEALLQCAPPAMVFLGLFITPIIYSVPIALMTAELATALPKDGGLVAWVTEACGPTVGGHNTYWQWLAYIFDSSVYPVLAGQYVLTVWSLGDSVGSEATGVSIVALIIVVFVTGLKLAGTQILVRFSTLLLVMSIFPSLIYMLWGMAYLEPASWAITSGVEMDWSMFISWLLWLYSGFFSLGSLAGEVEKPTYTFPRVVAVLVPVVILFNVTPLAISTSLDQDWGKYKAGHFTNLAERIAGEWLGYCFIMASNVCLIGLYNAQTMTCERSMSFFIEATFPTGIASLSNSRNRVVRYLFHKGQTGVAPFYILFTACITSCLVWLDYAFLVEFNMLQMSLVCTLFLYSFVYLRVKRPNMVRPFRLPGGIKTAIVVAIFPLACTGANVYFALTDNESDGLPLPYFKVFAFEGLLGLGIIANFLFVRRQQIKAFYRRFVPASHDDSQPLIASSPRPTDYSDLGDASMAMQTKKKVLQFQGVESGDGESVM